ncbi:MAG: hypothetical protein IJF16_05730 [Clostridia bacterium]|nr:hypothetical protein [Clostridia bacterium]
MAREMILVLDFGGNQAQLAARMIRNAKVYCQVMPADTPLGVIKEKAPAGIVCVGDSKIDIQDSGIVFNSDIFALCVPILAMGSACRALCLAVGGRLDGVVLNNAIRTLNLPENTLFEGVGGAMRRFARADRMILPKGFSVLCAVDGAVLAMTNDALKCTGVQFAPETNDIDSQHLLSNFALHVCRCSPKWTMRVFLEDTISQIREKVGSKKAFMLLSGGIDTSVCAMLMHRAIGDRLHCVFIDNGVLRINEADDVDRLFNDILGVKIQRVDAGERFMTALSGIASPERKRAVFNQMTLNVLKEELEKVNEPCFAVKGTIYTDVLERTPSTTVDKLTGFEGVIEPLAELFKDEVRALGEMLGIPSNVVYRQPFPQMGLIKRCVGEVNQEKIDILGKADSIVRQEIESAGVLRGTYQCFAVISDTKTTCIVDDMVASGYMIAVRAVNIVEQNHAVAARLPYELIERIVERITKEIPGVSRVVYDMTGKPSATVEWE